MGFQLPNFDPLTYTTIGLTITTAVLAFLTALYWHETRLSRKISQTPSFVLEPTLYTLGGTFHWVYLLNSGQTAKNIKVNCSWSKDSQSVGEKKYFILSLGKDSRANLEEIPIGDIIDKKQNLIIKIECKDLRNKTFKEELKFDFEKIGDEGRKISYQFDPMLRITQELEDISRQLSRQR